MQINQATIAELFKGFRTTYLEAYQASQAVWDRIAMLVPSSSKSELHGWLGAIPGMKELVDEVQIQNLSAHEFTIVNKEWESTIPVKELDIITDRYGIYNNLFADMGRVARQHPDDLMAALLVNGFTALGYTGKAFFAANQEPKAGGTKFSNSTTKKLSRDNYRAGYTNLKGRKNAEGRSMKLGTKLVLVVCPSDEPLAKEILIAERSSDGSTNIDRGSADILVLPELENYTAQTTDKPWFILETGLAIKPLILQEVLKTRLAAITSPDSDHVLKKHEFLYQSYGIYNAGYGLPELAYGSSGTAAA